MVKHEPELHTELMANCCSLLLQVSDPDRQRSAESVFDKGK
jgi:hypothetical protein